MREKHQVFYYLALTDFLDEYFWGRKGARTEPPDCSVFLGDEKLAKARGLLLAQGADIERPIFSLCPGSVNSEAKRWPEEDFARLADLLAETMNAQIVYLAADHERPLVERIQEATKRPGSANLAGRADMVTSMAIMNLSRMVISNDTGSAHLAVAASARVLTLFGPTSAGATAPYGPDAHVIEGSAACAPCRHFRCPLPDHPCMRSIGPEIVLKEVQEILHGGS
jgi:heptosyltransferase-2